MHVEAVRLGRLLDDLARLAEAERPGLLLEKRPVDLADVAEAAVVSFAPRFAGAGIEFRHEISSAEVGGDAARLGQITDNLLSNALRYTERGGKAGLSVRAEHDVVVLEVWDRGIGIPETDLGNVYKRFWRGDKSRSRAQEVPESASRSCRSSCAPMTAASRPRARSAAVRDSASSCTGRGSMFETRATRRGGHTRARRRRAGTVEALRTVPL